jgi:hypothetical protein
LPLSAAVISGRSRVPLARDEHVKAPTVVPAQYLTLEVEGRDLPEAAYLDGRHVPLLLNEAGSRGFLMIDTTGSVGFHSLRVGDAEWYFATQDAKLRLNGILTLLEFLEAEGLAWSGQLFFSDGSAIRSPKIDFAWLTRAAPRILELADLIAARPLRRAQLLQSHQPPGAGKLFLNETLALLRTNTRALVEEDDRGLIAIANRRYSPRVVVTGRLERSFDVVGNRRMTHLLLLALELCHTLQAEPRLPRAIKAQLRQLSADLRARLELFPFVQLRSRATAGKLPSRPASEEIADDRYRAVFDTYVELCQEMAWQPGVHIADRLAYVGFADQIYQAFVAVVLARAFDTKQVASSLWSDLSGPAFRSEAYDIYYDTVPPNPEFANWRDSSERPSDQKPDLTIVDRLARRGILADAKYRVEPSGRLPTSGIHDAQVYLQSFELKSIAICYPGNAPLVTHIAAKGYTILEVSVGPFPGLQDYLRNDVRPALEAAMAPLGS